MTITTGVQKVVRYPAFFPCLATLFFSAAILAGVMPGAPVATLARWLLSCAFLILAWWFLHAFTHADQVATNAAHEAEQSASMFRFAYMFSVYSFALLVLPFTAMLRAPGTTPDAGPIRLLRACVVSREAAQAPSPAPKTAPPTSTFVASGPVELCPPNPPLLVGKVTYPWLVSVGGVIAQECGQSGFDCAMSVEPAASAAPVAARPASAAPAAKLTPDTHTEPQKSPPMYSVRGGFVVPFYVVVFAFVGGVVNLTRRVPEYQKRSSRHFTGSATEPPVTLLEAREFMVFQIMQLITSPFIAMVAYYALEPKSIASAVGLAFVSGFSTESVLLLIRGMVNGLRPETTKTAATASATAQLHVLLKRQDGGPVATAAVELRGLPNASPPLTAQTAGSTGELVFKALESGTVWVVAVLDVAGPPAARFTATQKVQLVAGQTESIELLLI